MTKNSVEGVQIRPLKQIADERGKVMHMLRSDAPYFEAFGEIYFSMVNPGVVKAWKRHKKMTQNLAVPVGKIKLVIFDDRSGSGSNGSLQEIEAGEADYNLVTIPPLVWYGFQGSSQVPALIANCADLPHDPEEVERCGETDPRIPYRW